MVTGWLKTSFFPDFEDNAIRVSLTMPSNTGYERTKQHILHISDTADELSKEYLNSETGESYFKYFISVSGLTIAGNGGIDFGTNKGILIMEFEPPKRGSGDEFSLNEVKEKLRKRIGDIPGAEKLSLESSFSDFGRPISVSINGKDDIEIRTAVDDIREYLKKYPGVYDIQDNISSSREELKLHLKPLATALGLSQNDIASQVRQAIFGFEAQRIQRGFDDIKVMVRYPEVNRNSISAVNNIAISTPNSRDTISLSQLAELTPSRSPTSIFRVDQQRSVAVSANIDTKAYDIAVIRQDLKQFLDDYFIYKTDMTYSLDGQAETQAESNTSFMLGFLLVIITIYALLAIPFKSFGQPFIVMSIIPLALVGGVIGHLIMGLSFSVLSIMGMLGLTGIVVNDSLVLVDYINKKRSEGITIMHAVLTAGETRFRPVMLTSLTTFVGLLPLMFNQSLQAQALIPMAVSLGFGILFATMITLLITPVMYLVGHRIKHMIVS